MSRPGEQNEPSTTAERNVFKRMFSKLNSTNDGQSQELKYPKSVFFIVINEFCERFSYYGLRTILSMYLTRKLLYNEDDATVVYHTFTVFCYFFPFLGAIIADSWLGKFRTIFYLTLVYCAGTIVVSITAIKDLYIPQREITILGLFLIALGTGGIKPCVAAFGGDQFVVPEQEGQLKKFFSIFYFAINAGSFISIFLTPILREDVKCFNDDACYPLAFGVPAIVMVLALLVFLFGKRWYKMIPPQGDLMVKVCQCTWYAIRNPRINEQNHWLDKAEDKYGSQFVEDVKSLFSMLILYVPIPFFWTLFDQQGSRWTFQATRMNGDLGSFVLKPDQMQVINPILILIFIPLFETVVYPLFAKINFLKKPLQRLITGGVVAAIAFGISAVVEWQVEPSYAHLPSPGLGQLRIYNSAPQCGGHLILNSEITNNTDVNVQYLDKYVNEAISLTGSKEYQFKFTCAGVTKDLKLNVFEDEATSYIVFSTTTTDLDMIQSRKENLDKTDNADPSVMISYISDLPDTPVDICFKSNGRKSCQTMNKTVPITGFTQVPHDSKYSVEVNNSKVRDIRMDMGGAYVLLIHRLANTTYDMNLLVVSPPNSIHMLWQMPQYIVITAAEVMFSITGLEFSFTQAPISMKSVMSSIWLLTIAVGNVIVIVAAEVKIFSRQLHEFILFGALMLLDMLIFGLLAMRYKYRNVESQSTNAAN